MHKTRTIAAISIIPLLLLATACGTPTANPDTAAPQRKNTDADGSEEDADARIQEGNPSRGKARRADPDRTRTGYEPNLRRMDGSHELRIRPVRPARRGMAALLAAEQPNTRTVLVETILEPRWRMAAHRGRWNGWLRTAILHGQPVRRNRIQADRRMGCNESERTNPLAETGRRNFRHHLEARELTKENRVDIT